MATSPASATGRRTGSPAGPRAAVRAPGRRAELVLRAILLIVFGALCVWWACQIPYTPYGEPALFIERMGPDESMRFDLLQWIVENGALPRGDEPELLNSSWGFSYGFSVYGSTLLAVPGAAIAHALGAGAEGMVLAARLADVGLSIATLAILFCLSDRFFALAAARFLFVGLVAFLPQFMFLSSYFNCEALELFSVALVSFCLVKGVEGRWRLVHCCALGAALGICALSYYFAYALFPVSIVVYYVSVWRIRRGEGDLSVGRDLIARPLIVALVAFAVCGWFFVRNLILHGDLFGMRTISEFSERYALEELKPSNRVTPKSLGVSVPDMVLSGGGGQFAPWGERTFQSFVGVFGMMQIFLGRLEYAAYALVIGVGGAAGIARFAVDSVGRRARPQWRALVAGSCVILIAISVGFALLYSWGTDYQPQGRYAIAALPAIMLIVAYGYGGTLSPAQDGRHSRSLDSPPSTGAGRLSSIVALTVLCLWLALFAWVFATTIVPFAMAPLFA